VHFRGVFACRINYDFCCAVMLIFRSAMQGFFLAQKLILGLCNFNLPFYNKQRKGILK